MRIVAIALIAAAVVAVVLVVIAYRRDINAARERTANGSQIAQTPCGPIEWFALPAGLAGVSVNVWTACAEPQSAARPVAWHLVSASLK